MLNILQYLKNINNKIGNILKKKKKHHLNY